MQDTSYTGCLLLLLLLLFWNSFPTHFTIWQEISGFEIKKNAYEMVGNLSKLKGNSSSPGGKY